MMSKIYLYSSAVQTGKTSRLMSWVKGKNNVAGILTPDQEGLRVLYDIRSKKTYPMQVSVEDDSGEELIRVGRFTFLAKTMNWAQKILLEEMQLDPDWLVIDELGKLELKGIGLEPALGQVISHYQQQQNKGNLLVVVRDYLLEEAVRAYGIEEYERWEF